MYGNCESGYQGEGDGTSIVLRLLSCKEAEEKKPQPCYEICYKNWRETEEFFIVQKQDFSSWLIMRDRTCKQRNL